MVSSSPLAQITLSQMGSMISATSLTIFGDMDGLVEGFETFNVTVNPGILIDYPGLALPTLTITIEDNDGTNI